MPDPSVEDFASTLSVFTLYRDPGDAVRWLCDALGFVLTKSVRGRRQGHPCGTAAG